MFIIPRQKPVCCFRVGNQLQQSGQSCEFSEGCLQFFFEIAEVKASFKIRQLTLSLHVHSAGPGSVSHMHMSFCSGNEWQLKEEHTDEFGGKMNPIVMFIIFQKE